MRRLRGHQAPTTLLERAGWRIYAASGNSLPEGEWSWKRCVVWNLLIAQTILQRPDAQYGRFLEVTSGAQQRFEIALTGMLSSRR